MSNRVSRRQAGRWAQQDYDQQPVYDQQQAPPPPPAAPQLPASDDMSHRIEQLEQLADLRTQGVLTNEEFESQKGRLLA